MSKENSKLYICMYHYTRDLVHSRYPEIKGMDIAVFKDQIDFFSEKFNVVRMEEVIDAVEGNGDLPPRAALLTFDDGYIDNFNYAMPILENKGLQGSFFIPGKTFAEHKLLDVNKIHYILASADIMKLVEDLKERLDHYRGREFDYQSNAELWNEYAKETRFDIRETVFVKRVLQTAIPERVRNMISSDLFGKYVGITEEQLAYELYMNEDQIRVMKKHGMFIGVHGYDHYWLGNLSDDKMQEDISRALEVMSDFVDEKHWVMNYPYGNYSEDVLKYIDAMGACLGLTTEVKVADIYLDCRLLLPRLDCNDFPPKTENYRSIR